MWPLLGPTLFPPPTKAWLQAASSDPEAQGWGAWRTEDAPLGLGGGGGEKGGDAEDDAGFPLSLLELENLAESPQPDQELAAVEPKPRATEQAEGLPLSPKAAGRSQGPRLALKAAGPRPQSSDPRLHALGPVPLSSGCPFPGAPQEKVEADHRSIYVGNVDYQSTAQELEAHFSHCGEVHRVTILCDRFSGHPKGYAYVEFTAQSSARAAVDLHESVFRGRVIKVLPKRTNFPGISSTDRGGLRTHPGARPALLLPGGPRGRPRFRPRGQSRAGARPSPRFSPY